MSTVMHKDVERLAFLLGTWVGRGHGVYPTIEDFDYEESVVFAHVGKPFVSYVQRTKGQGGPLHSEAGFFRAVGDTDLEVTIAQPTGLVEIHLGSQSGTRLELRSHTVGRTPTAVDVRSVTRLIEVHEHELRYELHMEAVGQPHQLHLEATLERQS